jgi:predicted Ser/Thr protein kinase
MTRDRYQQIKAVFLQAVELPREQWPAAVDRLCAGDDDLKREVDLLLACHVDVRHLGEHAETARKPGSQASTRAESAAGAAGGDARRAMDDPMATGPLPMPSAGPIRSQSDPGLGRTMSTRGDLLGAQADGPRAGEEPASGRKRPRSSLFIEQGRFLPGVQVAGRYRIIALVGKGGMGEVYRAEDLKLGQAIALKFLPPNLASDRQRLQSFIEEVRTARAVSHPNVCRVYDLEEHAGEPFIAMEYIDGETLDSLISRIGMLPEKKAAQLAQQMCAGLSAIHAEGILHRDLKPANIMIDGRGQVRVTDFGLASVREIAGLEAIAGTPGFVAPEALLGQTVTERSDVYALGLVLYELFSGVPAYRGKTRQELVRLQQTVDPDPVAQHAPEVSPEVDRAISACLQREPSDRPESMRRVSAMLPGGDPVAAAMAAGETPSPEMVAASGSFGVLKPWEAIAAVLVFVALLGIGTYLSRSGSMLPRVSLGKAPAVLADRARTIIEQLGYTADPKGGSWSYDLYEEFVAELRERDKTQFRAVRLGRPRPAPIDFWYRQSGGKLVPFASDGVITFDDPPLADRGMLSVRLTPEGHLRELEVLNKDLYWPNDGIGPSPPAPEIDRVAPNWSLLFSAAGLDITKFRPVEPRRIPPVYADTRVAWAGTYPESPDEPVQVEAASLGGRPVSFRTVEVNWLASQVAIRQVTLLTEAQKFGIGLLAIVQVVSVVGAIILARVNLKRRRGDQIGATKIALGIAGLTLIAGVLRADTLASHSGPFGILPGLLADSIGAGLMAWVLYLGIEPYVRRTWPDLLVSWTRVLDGQVRDPLVGQSVLAGAIVGCFGLTAVYVNRAIPEWLGQTAAMPYFASEVGILPLGGLGENVAAYCILLVKATQAAMGFVAVIALLRLALKRPWASLIVFGVLQVTLWVLRPDAMTGWWSPVLVACMVAPALLILVRYGLLALMVSALVFMVLTSMPITWDTSAWYHGRSVTALILVGLTVLYGALYAVIGTRDGRALISARPARA